MSSEKEDRYGEFLIKAWKYIDSWMQHIWKEVVKKEYENSRIFAESNLHLTIYFHLRKLIESSGREKLFIYSEMPFSTTMRGKGKKNPRVDLAVVILDEDKEAPIDLLAVIEVKHYDYHANSIGIRKDLDNLEALRKGVYYPYSEKYGVKSLFLTLLKYLGKHPFDGKASLNPI